jgi:hypothetical protein
MGETDPDADPNDYDEPPDPDAQDEEPDEDDDDDDDDPDDEDDETLIARVGPRSLGIGGWGIYRGAATRCCE